MRKTIFSNPRCIGGIELAASKAREMVQVKCADRHGSPGKLAIAATKDPQSRAIPGGRRLLAEQPNREGTGVTRRSLVGKDIECRKSDGT